MTATPLFLTPGDATIPQRLCDAVNQYAQQIAINQIGSGKVNAAYTYNHISITDNIDSGGNATDGFAVFLGLAGNAVNGGRQAFQSTVELTTPTSASNSNRDYVAVVSTAIAAAGDGGGAGTERGSLFAENPVIWVQAAAQHLSEASGGEVNTICESGCSVVNKYGWKIVQESTDAVAGSGNDAALFMGNQSGAVGWGTLWQIGDAVNASPLKTTGTIIKVLGSPTITNGIDLSGATITGAAYKSPGSYSVDGSGNIVSGGGLTINGVATIANATAVPAGGTTGVGLRMSSTANLGIFFGSGAPTLSAAQGSLYLRTDGSSTSTRAYINTNGSTGWTAITTAT